MVTEVTDQQLHKLRFKERAIFKGRDKNYLHCIQSLIPFLAHFLLRKNVFNSLILKLKGVVSVSPASQNKIAKILIVFTQVFQTNTPHWLY